MPAHIHPVFRDKEKAMEQVGVIKTLNSVGYTTQVAAEAAGTQPAPRLIVGANWNFLGQSIAHTS